MNAQDTLACTLMVLAARLQFYFSSTIGAVAMTGAVFGGYYLANSGFSIIVLAAMAVNVWLVFDQSNKTSMNRFLLNKIKQFTLLVEDGIEYKRAARETFPESLVEPFIVQYEAARDKYKDE